MLLIHTRARAHTHTHTHTAPYATGLLGLPLSRLRLIESAYSLRRSAAWGIGGAGSHEGILLLETMRRGGCNTGLMTTR
jgi:hypothetical protein